MTADAKKNIVEVIRENMGREWLDTDPSPECFDRDEDRMALLLGPRDVADVRTHLLTCCRCRYLYAVHRDALGKMGPW